MTWFLTIYLSVQAFYSLLRILSRIPAKEIRVGARKRLQAALRGIRPGLMKSIAVIQPDNGLAYFPNPPKILFFTTGMATGAID